MFDAKPAPISRRSLITFGFTPQDADRRLRVHRTAMACRFEVTLAERDAHHVSAARAALDEAARLEAVLSVFRDTSELTHVNRRAAAGPVAVSRDLFALLSRCQRLHAETDGAFDITSTPLVRCWGFLARAPRVPPAAVLDAERSSVGMQHVRLDGDTGTVSFARAGMELSLGSIGKGYALDSMGRLLRRQGVTRALVSAGGSSILAIGFARVPWTIDVSSPQLTGPLARLRLSSGAVGTSGAGEQYVIADGVRYGHVIDPATGWPARGVLAASVVTRDAATADALSTAFLVGGPALAERYCRCHPDTLALVTLDERPRRPRLFGRYPGAQVEICHVADA